MIPLLTLAAFILAASSVHAAEPPMVEVRATFLYATDDQMKSALAAAGLPELPGRQISPAQFETVRTKLRETGADIFSEPQAVIASGLKASINSVRELRYPTEFSISKDAPAKWTPTAFEARNVGVEMEFEAVAQNDEIDLSVSPTVTTFLGFIDYGRGKEPPLSGALPIESLLKAPLKEGGCWQPVFLQFKVTSSFKLRSGHYVLLGGMMKAERIPEMAGLPAPPAPKTEPRIFIFLTAKTAE